MSQHVTKISDGDAVTLIVSTTLSFTNIGQSVMFEAEGTYIFIMNYTMNLLKRRKVHRVKLRGCDTTSPNYEQGKTHVM